VTDADARRPPLAQVILVTGKGGVGKTTVATGLAATATRRGGGAVLVEFGDGKSGQRALGRRPDVAHVVVQPQEAIQRMSADLFGSKLLARVVTGNFAMRRLLSAAPALRELAQLEWVRRVAEENPARRVVVDMPATGHGVAWLRVPAQLRDLLRAGPLAELAARLARELVAPGRCSVVIVTLPEQLVLQETLELCQAMTDQVGLAPARVVVNRVPEPLPAHTISEAQRIAARGGAVAEAATRLIEVVAARDQARGHALDAMRSATRELSVTPVVLPDHPVDPTSELVATWLENEAFA